MKIEARGKYAGVKVHLDGDEAAMFLDFTKGETKKADVIEFASKLGKKIHKLVGEHPNLLKERTEEEIKASLLSDKEKIENQLHAMSSGEDWKKVK